MKFRSRFFCFEVLFCFFILIFKFFLIDHHFINFDNMQPNIKNNDIIIYKKYSYGWSIWNGSVFRKFGYCKKKKIIREPNHGDLALFFYNRDKSKIHLKRIVATEGESVQIIEGTLHINNEPVNKVFLEKNFIINKYGEKISGSTYSITLNNGLIYKIFEDDDFKNSSRYNTNKYIVTQGSVWFQEDYYSDDNDSFDIDLNGPVSLDNLIGKPFGIIIGSKMKSEKKDDSIFIYIIKMPYKILNYFWNIDIKRVWTQLH